MTAQISAFEVLSCLHTEILSELATSKMHKREAVTDRGKERHTGKWAGLRVALDKVELQLRLLEA